MKLTLNHIQELYKFTRKHYVEYYDVQTELVDHLANDIEQILEVNPNFSFEEARDKSFKKFGVFGFMDVVEKKEWQMTKKYLKLVWKLILEWFRLPKIVLTIVLTFAFYELQQFEFAHAFYMTVSFTLMTSLLVIMFIRAKKLSKKYKETGKKWMLEQIINVNGLANVFFLLYWFYEFPFSNQKDFLVMGDFRKILSALIITLTLILAHIMFRVIPKKADELLQETYPEYKLS
jgi:hypothetical protein